MSHPMASISGVSSLVQNTSMNAVVKVYCVHTEPNFSLPWQRLRQHASTSSGFLVAAGTGERWLLTNAHSVAYHSQVALPPRFISVLHSISLAALASINESAASL